MKSFLAHLLSTIYIQFASYDGDADQQRPGTRGVPDVFLPTGSG